MSKFILALGAAALAIGAPGLAQKENKGQGGGGKGGQQKAESGPGNGGGGNGGNVGGGNGRGKGQMKADRGDGGQAMRGDFGKPDKVRGNDRHAVVRGNDRQDYASGNDRKNDRMRIATRDDRDIDPSEFDRNDGVRVIVRNFGGGFASGYDNCPPGLAKKDNGCLPPGQAKKYLGSRIEQSYLGSRVPYQYRRWYRDDEDHFYRYGDNNIYRVSRGDDVIDGIIPLFAGGGYNGGYYALGDQWPDSYDFYNVPYQYRSYYADSSDYRYRYGDGAIYRVNGGSGVVDSIVALLAGDLGVGSRLPVGYDTYNVPFDYRDRYADSAENWYRFNDGYIYQVDPKTRLISAVIDAIV